MCKSFSSLQRNNYLLQQLTDLEDTCLLQVCGSQKPVSFYFAPGTISQFNETTTSLKTCHDGYQQYYQELENIFSSVFSLPTTCHYHLLKRTVVVVKQSTRNQTRIGHRFLVLCFPFSLHSVQPHSSALQHI